MEKFYVLRTIPNSSNKIASFKSITGYDPIELLRGKVPLKDTVFQVKKGFEKNDFLETEWPGILLCSSRVVDLMTKHNIQGCSFTRVTLMQKKVAVEQQYAMLHVSANPGPFDYSRSEPLTQTVYGFAEIKGRYVNEEHVKGYDIFAPDKTVMIFVTEKLRALLEGEKFTNLSLIDNTEYTASVPVQMLK